jgi:glycosyltransferase involved in cell wall biosynthesis
MRDPTPAEVRMAGRGATPASGRTSSPRADRPRIAIVAPFDGPALAQHFAFDGQSLPPGYPGAALMSVLARELADRGHEVATITTDYFTPPEELAPFKVFRAPGISAYFCPQRPRAFRPAAGRPGRAADLFAYERECLRAALLDFAPDVIHANWTYEFAWAALDTGIPTVTTAHDSPAKVLRYMPNVYRAARYLMARLVIPRCTHLTTVSPALADDLQKWAKVPIRIIANPISAHLAMEPGCAPDAFTGRRVIMVGNGWTRLKNGEAGLRAFAIARRQDPTLELACFGKDWEPSGVAERWARQHGLEAGVTFHGPAPHRILHARMQQSAVLVHPSRTEACCMAIAEAMTLGLPVIGGRSAGGVPWQLDQGRAGVLVDIEDPKAIADAMGALLADRAKWQAISNAGRTRAREIFTSDRVVDAYVETFNDAMKAATA